MPITKGPVPKEEYESNRQISKKNRGILGMFETKERKEQDVGFAVFNSAGKQFPQ